MSTTTRCTVAAAVLAVPVVAEVLRPEPFDSTAGELLFAASQLLGWVLLASVVAGAPAVARAASPRGRVTVLVAAGLQVAFAAVYGITAFRGEPWEAVFGIFLLGFVALLVGGLLWAARLRRVPGGRVAAAGLGSVAVLGALAMLVGRDPFHDILLVSSYAAWVLVGRGFTALAGTPRYSDLTAPTVDAGRVG